MSNAYISDQRDFPSVYALSVATSVQREPDLVQHRINVDDAVQFSYFQVLMHQGRRRLSPAQTVAR